MRSFGATPSALPNFFVPDIAFPDETSIVRRVTVKPAMCGHNSLFFGQVGDWTWETVSALCQTNVFSARNSEGAPTYLAFCYFHTQGSALMHPYMFTIGDELRVTSRVFDFGSESVLTLHRIEFDDGGPQRPVELDEFYEHPRTDCMYIENFNRWVTRSKAGSNQDLMSSAPTEFCHDHLPTLPPVFSPRTVLRSAARKESFYDPETDGYSPVHTEYQTTYRIDGNRDINGVGLIYFASFFYFVDTAILRMWQWLGRSERQFIGRHVLDHKLCYFGNADLDSTLAIVVRLREHCDNPNDEMVDVVIRDQATARLLAVAGVRMLIDRYPEA
jgi:probable biosynthetic protein (TIGR04098 family)